jgi:hypothetical protein
MRCRVQSKQANLNRLAFLLPVDFFSATAFLYSVDLAQSRAWPLRAVWFLRVYHC